MPEYRAIAAAEYAEDAQTTVGLKAAIRDNAVGLYENGRVFVAKQANQLRGAASSFLYTDPELVYSVGANEEWEFCIVLNIDIWGGVFDFQFLIVPPSGSTCVASYLAYSDSGLDVTGTVDVALDTATTVTYGGLVTDRPFILQGHLTSGLTRGPVWLQWGAYHATGDPYLTVNANSFLKAFRMDDL